MRHWSLAFPAAAALAVLPAHASTVTMNGTVTNPSGLSAAGDAFSATFSYDDALFFPTFGTSTTPDYVDYRFIGDIAVSFTGAYDFTGTTESYRLIYNPGIAEFTVAGVRSAPSFTATFTLNRPAGVYTPPTPAELAGATGTFTYAGVFGTGPGSPPGQFGGSGTVTFAGAVPEPASWALLIGGFGLVGGTLRARPRPAVPA